MKVRLSLPRIPPIEESAFDEAQKEAFARHPPNQKLLNIFKTLANHVKLLTRWRVFANHILGKSTLPVRDREILILRTGWLCQSAYEWSQHVKIGLDCGVSEEEIERIKTGSGGAGWGKLEQALLKTVEELHKDFCISDATWQALSQHYDTQQLMDVVFTVGQYHTVAMALNSFGVQLEEETQAFNR